MYVCIENYTLNTHSPRPSDPARDTCIISEYDILNKNREYDIS